QQRDPALLDEADRPRLGTAVVARAALRGCLDRLTSPRPARADVTGVGLRGPPAVAGGAAPPRHERAPLRPHAHGARRSRGPGARLPSGAPERAGRPAELPPGLTGATSHPPPAPPR